MQTLDQIAKVIRSKNAGPFCLTLDVLFDKPADYQRVLKAEVITAGKMATLYKQPPENVQVYHHERALAMKVTLVRWTPAGSLTDSDIYGAQQHILLYKLPVPAA